MDDRTLLERAARAAGMELVLWHEDGTPHAARPGDTVSFRWNPLIYDGDALRLAVKLQINVLAAYCGPKAIGRPNGTRADAGGPTPPSEPWGSDPCAATRRAIVRAAAALEEPQQ